MKYSIIVPVYNRPDEVDELLDSLTRQVYTDFEVIIVEDGSATPCKQVCDKYASSDGSSASAGKLNLRYFMKKNSGPGQSRNYGAERANGEYLIILDSDVVVPDGYLQAVDEELTANPCDAFGGADASHPSFTPVQKAISYSMTSFFTTGGIRGGKAGKLPASQKHPASQNHPASQKHPASYVGSGASASRAKALDKFYPRSYNMGIRRDVYLKLGGFSKMRFGEDIDFSYRIVEAGYKSRLFPGAWVWHKRRTDLKKFFRQVYNSGIARINLEKRHPGTMKLVHMLPMVFTIGVIGLILISAFGRAMMYYDNANFWTWYYVCALPWLPILLYSGMILMDSSIQNRSLKIGTISVAAAFTQLMGYGFGFIEAWWKRCVCGKDEFQAFEKNFYK